ncbi:MAG: hypothetical protein Q9227_002596 [Pyrenula ochraceoflavens]
MLRSQILRSTRSIQNLTFSSSRRSTLPRPAPRIPQRWVTTEAEARTEGDREAMESSQAEKEDASAAAPSEEGNPLQKELDIKNREIIDLKDKYLRSVADFRNLQERTRRDMDSARQFAIQRFATDLIESIDNLDRALASVPADAIKEEDPEAPPNKDLLSLHGGLKMTSEILMQTLKKHGLERFDPIEVGRKFDPNLDEATFMTKAEGKEDGDVLMTQSKGFLLNGRVLRPAKVGVVRNS